MTRQRSLRKRAEFDATLRSGTRIVCNGLTLVAAPRPGRPGRLGLAVRASSAVERNRTKRRLRAAFIEADVKGVDIVARAGSTARSLRYQEMVNMFRRTMERQ